MFLLIHDVDNRRVSERKHGIYVKKIGTAFAKSNDDSLASRSLGLWKAHI